MVRKVTVRIYRYGLPVVSALALADDDGNDDNSDHEDSQEGHKYDQNCPVFFVFCRDALSTLCTRKPGLAVTHVSVVVLATSPERTWIWIAEYLSCQKKEILCQIRDAGTGGAAPPTEVVGGAAPRAGADPEGVV